MTAKDYTTNVETAKALVDKYGRTVKLRKLQTLPETGKPWRVDGTPEVTAADADYIEVKAVFIGPSKALTDDFLTDVEDVAIVAGPTDYSLYQQLNDGGKLFKVIRQQQIKPGGTIVLTYFGIAR